MLDTNVFDALVADDETLAAYQEAVQLRRVEPFTTQVQEDQLALAPALKRKRFTRVPRTVVPAVDLPADPFETAAGGTAGTGGAAEPGGAARRASGTGIKPGRLADLVIGRTATALGLVLVTDDRLLRDTLSAQPSPPVVWSAADLLRFVAA